MKRGPRPLALITGASSGLGRDFAALFAEDGHDLILVARGEAALQATADEIRADHEVDVQTLIFDLAQPEAVAGLVQAVQARGRPLDVLVNNAGYGLFGEIDQLAVDDTLAMLRLNMLALTELTQRFLPGLLARRGKVLNIASTAAFQPGPYMAPYYASKAYVLSLSEAIAEELAGRGVQVTVVCPGPTRTGFQARAAMLGSGLLRLPMPTSIEVARDAYAAFRRGRRVYVPGWSNWLMAQSVRFTPRRLVTRLVRWISAPRRGA